MRLPGPQVSDTLRQPIRLGLSRPDAQPSQNRTASREPNTTAVRESQRQWVESDVVEPHVIPSEPLAPFKYDVLDSHVDCIRVLEVDEHLCADGLLVCRLTQVPFADRPKFEALSYMWGNPNVKRTICLNGAEFDVGENLFDALHFLRRRPAPGTWLPIWIDAVCINQGDTAERSAQVRIMHHIYDRAQTVLIWLGKTYDKYQKPVTEEKIRDWVHHLSPYTRDDNRVWIDTRERHHWRGYVLTVKDKEMRSELRSDAYWNRVWIIQEIGKAQRIMVYFGKMTLNWAEFNYFVDSDSMSMIDNESEGPIRFNWMKRNAGNESLRSLLGNHRRALCGVPKDKVYGLVGLAQDSFDFPIDYDKNDTQVWLDTVKFTSENHLLPSDQIISSARLVKELLFDHSAAAPPQPQCLGLKASFQLEATIIGRIRAIGPSTKEIVSHLSKTNEWQAQLRTAYDADTFGGVYQENDKLRRAILDLDDNQISNMLSSRAVEVLKKASCMGKRSSFDHITMKDAPKPLSRGPGPCLFQLEGQTASSKLGVVPSQADSGDIICFVTELQVAVVVKQGQAIDCVKVEGRALFTDDMAGSPVSRKGEMGGDFSIGVDARTLWELLA